MSLNLLTNRTRVLYLVQGNHPSLLSTFTDLYDRLSFNNCSYEFTLEAVICKLSLPTNSKLGFLEVHTMTHATNVFRIDYTIPERHIREVLHKVDVVIQRTTELLNE